MTVFKIGLALLLTLVMNFTIASEKSSFILVMGDSLSAAYGIKPAQGWVNLMNEPLKEYRHWQIINASVSGETSSGGSTRLPALLKKYQPKIVIVELGGNDGLRGQPLKILQQNLQTMIDACKDSGAQVLLVGMQIPSSYGARYTREFKDTYQQLAEKNKLPLIPFLLEGVAVQSELMQRDAIHPTAEAQPLIMNNVWPWVKKMLKEK